MDMEDLFPWGAIISPTSDDALCPSARYILGTFAVVNGITTVFSMFLGNRKVLHWLSGRKFFANPDSTTHRWWWIVVAGLQLAANALVGFLFKMSPGYKLNMKIWELMLVFTVRPRLSWIVVVALGQYKSDYVRLPDGPSKTELLRDSGYSPYNSSSQLELNKKKIEDDPSQYERPWSSAAKSQAFAEIALQIISIYVMGTIVRFGDKHGYYVLRNNKYAELPASAHLMFGGALYFVVSGTILLLLEIVTVLSIYAGDDKSTRKKDESMWAFMFVFYNLSTTWLASWLFWAGFVKTAGAQSSYCPPNLIAQGSIWSGFSILGLILGAGGS